MDSPNNSSNPTFFLSMIKSVLSLSLVFLFPLFFLPFTQEFFITNKLYLLGFGSLALLLISSLEFLITKKFVWKKSIFDTSLFLILVTMGLSIVITSPNKIQALLNPNFGLVGVFSLVVLYFYLSKNTDKTQKVKKVLSVSSVVLAIVTIIFFFQPFHNINLPQNLQFLKNSFFTPMGNLIDLGIFLGFMSLYFLISFIDKKKSVNSQSDHLDHQSGSSNNLVLPTVYLLFTGIALVLVLFTIFKTPSSKTQNPNSIFLPPYRLSWYSSVEVLKKPVNALFGVGIDNYSSMFTRVKDFSYNQSNLWKINSFNSSRSAILHILTETGLFGLVAFGVLVFIAFNQLKEDENKKTLKFLFGYLLLVLLLFPISLPVLFLFFVLLVLLTNKSTQTTQFFDLSDFIPVYIGIIIFSFAFIGVNTYLLGRSYAGEVYFNKSLQGLVKNNAKDLYDNQRQAVILNPYNERFRINFAQTNLLIANNIISKKTEENKKNKGKSSQKNKLSDQEKQTVNQAIQSAIAQAKAGVSLNSQKASNWANLAGIYRNILNVAKGSDVWTISAYQRAIISDPQNVGYRIGLGGVYYSLGKYDQASNLFEQAISIKPDFANSHYNFAWANFKLGKYQVAASEMQNVLNLLDPKESKADYDQAKKDLKAFKSKIPQSKTKENPAKTNQVQPSQLSLPTPPVATVEPKIELPKDFSPPEASSEAKP